VNTLDFIFRAQQRRCSSVRLNTTHCDKWGQQQPISPGQHECLTMGGGRGQWCLLFSR